MVRWSESATLKFVYYYKLHKCLWDPKDDMYTVKNARNSAYANLVLEMDLEDFDVRAAKVKIKNLRAHYFTELKKVRYAEAMGERYEPTLYWFKEMDSFLRDVISHIPRLQQPEVITADSIYDSSSIYEIAQTDMDEDSMGKASPIFHLGETSSASTRGPASLQQSRQPQRTSPAPSGRKRKRPSHNSNTSSDATIDEFEVFGKSVAAQLRKLSLSRAFMAQSRIQTILTEERIQDLETSPPPKAIMPPSVATTDSGSRTSGSGSTADSGTESGVDGCSSSMGGLDSCGMGESVLGLPSPPSLDQAAVSFSETIEPNFHPPKTEKEKKEVEPKKPEVAKPSNDVIQKAECELITLDEDDPLAGIQTDGI